MKRNLGKRIFWAVLSILVIGLFYGVYYFNSMLPIITGYPAKYLCSLFLFRSANRPKLKRWIFHFSFIKYVRNTVDFQDSSVTSSFLWGKSKAIYRKGFWWQPYCVMWTKRNFGKSNFQVATTLQSGYDCMANGQYNAKDGRNCRYGKTGTDCRKANG